MIARDEKEKVSKRADYYEEAKAGDQDKYLRYNCPSINQKRYEGNVILLACIQDRQIFFLVRWPNEYILKLIKYK